MNFLVVGLARSWTLILGRVSLLVWIVWSFFCSLLGHFKTSGPLENSLRKFRNNDNDKALPYCQCRPGSWT